MMIQSRDLGHVKKVEILISEWAEETGTDYINLRQRFSELAEDERERLYFHRGHWTPYGHEVVSEIVAAHVEAESLLVPRGF